MATAKRLPAEWEPQSGVLLTWPHHHSDWADILSRVEPVYLSLARHIAARERLIILCHDRAHQAYVRDVLIRHDVPLPSIAFAVVPTNDTWIRDYGPITLVQNERTPLLLDFTFNGWGGKFDAEIDNQATGALYRSGVFGDAQLSIVPLVLEGGSIEVDGAGSLLTTSRCLLAPTRNPALSRTAIENHLRAILGIDRLLWLENGHLEGDDTDSHIDTLVRFCNIDTLCYVACDDRNDSHYPALKAMEEELKALRRRDGQPYCLMPLPWPGIKRNSAGKRLPASYANFLIINQAVLVPTYDDAADTAALARIHECFPDRDIIGIDSLPLIHQYGSIHCVTMQLPAAVKVAMQRSSS